MTLTLIGERATPGAILERRSKQERLSISLPAELVGYVRQRAMTLNEPQSAVVADALARMMFEERRRELIEGLIEDADWSRALAREEMAAAAPVPD